jgi:fatty-acyl-CoA synthase
MNPFESGLDKNQANFQALTPLSFLSRTAGVFPNRTALVHGDQRITWRDAFERCRRLASALEKLGIEPGDTVAALLPNTPPMWEAHMGVPAMGAVLNALNVRLDAQTIAFILGHGQAKALIVDRAFCETAGEALSQLERKPHLIEVDDPMDPSGEPLGGIDYEAFLGSGDPDYPWRPPADEWQALSLNYTSGTTGNPKGVVYHHRGAYLNAIGNIMAWNMAHHPVYLWTLPMFHCNGWCFPWTITAMGGTHVCLRKVDGATIYRAIAEHGVTHLCGAPIVMQMLLATAPEDRTKIDHTVEFMTAAAPPPAAVLAAMAERGFRVTHVYGLTEVYGPAVVCAWHEGWDGLEVGEQARLQARQGVNYPVLEGLMVADPDNLEPVAKDGQTIGEVFMCGNIVMRGYLKNSEASQAAFEGGWFHTGDLGVWHPDGYIEIKDRAKDIIISGGENISSIEVEDALYRHPAIEAAAVVAKPDETWGETPCAFVELKPGAEAEAEEIIAFCRDNLAHFKAPRFVVFGPIPKTSTGKVQKYRLRQRAKEI